jgi:hypothetical protein
LTGKVTLVRLTLPLPRFRVTDLEHRGMPLLQANKQ